MADAVVSEWHQRPGVDQLQVGRRSGLTLMPTGAASIRRLHDASWPYWENACISENVTWTGTNSIGVSYSWYGQSGLRLQRPDLGLCRTICGDMQPGCQERVRIPISRHLLRATEVLQAVAAFCCGFAMLGTAFVDDSTKCATGQTCSSGVCAASCTMLVLPV